MLRLLSICFFLLLSFNTIAQSILDQRLDFEVTDRLIPDALLDLSEAANISIAFNSKLFDAAQTVSLKLENQSLRRILQACLQNSQVGFKLDGQRILLFRKAPPMYTISGYLIDQSSGEPLVAATIYDKLSKKGTTTNEYGFFSLRLISGDVHLQCSYLGFQSEAFHTHLHENTQLQFELQPSLTLDEVLVTDKNTLSAQLPTVNSMGQVIDLNRIQQIPAIGGESDLFQHLQMQPGIQSGADGLGGLNIYGGSADQNLILLDGVPIFNPSHTLGIFSIFNPSIIKSARLQKDGFSARYGGRLSSVLDIRTREGNIRSYSGELSLSTIATKAYVEGPIQKEKSGFMVSFRRSHIDPFIRSSSKKQKRKVDEAGETDYYFYDINAKLHSRLSSKDRLFFSFYKGGDRFSDNNLWRFDDELGYIESEDQQGIHWGNTIGAIRWNHLYNEQLFSNTTLTFSEYNYQSENGWLFSELYEDSLDNDNYITFFKSTIQDAALRMDFDYYPNHRHHLLFGGSVLWRRFRPGSIEEFNSEGLVDYDNISDYFDDVYRPPSFNSLENNLYLEDHFKVSPRLSLLMGLHTASFTNRSKTYFSAQPRLGLFWNAPKIFNGRLTVSRMVQFLHVLTSSGGGLPSDLWVPSTKNIGPQSAWVAASEIMAAWPNGWQIKSEAYYKRMKGLISYIEEAQLPSLFENNPLYWEEEVSSGTGRAYGASVQLNKNGPKQQGSISYTWARSWRTFELTNNGQEYPFTFDRPHTFQIYLRRKLIKNLWLSANWQYRSGQAITLLVSETRFLINDNLSPPSSQRLSSFNGYRMPAYHRLDFTLQMNWQKKNWNHSLQLGLYNAYNRLNPYFMYQLEDPIFPESNGLKKQKSLPILPSIGYSIRFSNL